MTFKAPDSLSEQIADYLAERIIRGELAPGERIQSRRSPSTQRQPRSVREALLILERRHLVAILPRRGAHVTVLDERSVRSLCALMGEFYILLGNAVAQKWRTDADLRPFTEIQQRLQRAHDQLDIKAFVADSFAVMRAAYPFADNPFLQETVENLQPAMSRAYYLSLDQRQANMIDYLDLFARLLDAVVARDLPRIREVLTAYGQRSCELVLAALARG